MPHSNPWRRATVFLRLLIRKAERDNIFFMAGAISFNVLVASVPLLLLLAGASGFLLKSEIADPAGAFVTELSNYLPVFSRDPELFAGLVTSLQELVSGRAGFSVAGAVLLVWFSTRLVGTLRTVLSTIFETPGDRGIIHGKLFDMQIVIVAGALFLMNMLATGILRAIRTSEFAQFPWARWIESHFGSVITLTTAIVIGWALFVTIYRFLPQQKVPWKTALVAGSVTALLHELLKWVFSWYVLSVASYTTVYGNLANLAVLFFWIYYGSIVFILGGEAGYLATGRHHIREDVESEAAVLAARAASAAASGNRPGEFE